jgi:hypothetical protein
MTPLNAMNEEEQKNSNIIVEHASLNYKNIHEEMIAEDHEISELNQAPYHQMELHQSK